MSRINFLGIGAQKAGTTWLFYNLKEHSEIYMPETKELHFFNGKHYNNFKQYNAKFDFTKVCGEITPMYLFDYNVPERIYAYNPDIKFIIFLRNPTHRAVSQYKMEIERGTLKINISLKDAFNKDISKFLSIKKRGHYIDQLKRYFDLFPKENIHIYLYENIPIDGKLIMYDIFKFIGVDSNFVPTGINKIVKPQETLYKNKGYPVKVKQFEIDFIKNYYVKKIERLENYLNIDLKIWKK